jgi:hypothetical protein
MHLGLKTPKTAYNEAVENVLFSNNIIHIGIMDNIENIDIDAGIPDSTFVYLIKVDGRFKIGKTSSLLQKMLKYDDLVSVSLLACVECADMDEAKRNCCQAFKDAFPKSERQVRSNAFKCPSDILAIQMFMTAIKSNPSFCYPAQRPKLDKEKREISERLSRYLCVGLKKPKEYTVIYDDRECVTKCISPYTVIAHNPHVKAIVLFTHSPAEKLAKCVL